MRAVDTDFGVPVGVSADLLVLRWRLRVTFFSTCGMFQPRINQSINTALVRTLTCFAKG